MDNHVTTNIQDTLERRSHQDDVMAGAFELHAHS
jgi:hypothetical protein